MSTQFTAPSSCSINSNLVCCVPWIVEWAMEANSTFMGLLPIQVSDPYTGLLGTNNRIHSLMHGVCGRKDFTQPGSGRWEWDSLIVP